MYRLLNTLAVRLLPSWLYHQLVSRWDPDGLKKYFANTGWMMLGRIATFAVSFFTITFVARYLGPENLGKLSYAQSFVAIFSMFASLGIDQIVYRELVARPNREGEIIGTAITLKGVCGLLTLLITVIAATAVNSEPLITWLIGLIALTFILQPLGTVGLVFNARVLSKYPTYVTLGLAFVIPALKIGLVFFEQGILYFAALIALEALLLSVANLALYYRIFSAHIKTWRISLSEARILVYQSWPLMLASASGFLYARIDQVMIHHFLGSTAVGLYEMAVRLTDPLAFIPGVIIGSLFPAIVNARHQNRHEYRKRLRSLALLCIGVSTGLASLLYTISPFLIPLLLGSSYLDTVGILQLYVWSTIGTIATSLIYNFLIVEGRTKSFLGYTVLGALTNIGLNALLIPLLGVAGAIYATILTLTTIVAAFFIIQTLHHEQHSQSTG
jgi:PST family polysaccharide transporter